MLCLNLEKGIKTNENVWNQGRKHVPQARITQSEH